MDDDVALLHEMIQLHEFVINELPIDFHGMLYWALYTDSRKGIPQLDEIITGHAHLLTESSLYAEGGLHDILFLLKSFDLDRRMGYPLGTVFGYGKSDKFSSYGYDIKQQHKAPSAIKSRDTDLYESTSCGYLVMKWASLRSRNSTLLFQRGSQSFGGHWWAREIGLVDMQRQKHPFVLLVGTMVGITKQVRALNL